MDTKTSLDKGRYQAPLCTVIALNSDSSVMQASIVTLSIIEMTSGGFSTESFDAPVSEDNLWL